MPPGVAQMNTYRKLTEDELRVLYTLLQAKFSGKNDTSRSYTSYQVYAKKYFPAEAAVMVIGISSEYNDETYNNRAAYVQVLDKSGKEILPLNGKEREARKEGLKLDIGDKYETDEQIEDIVVSLSSFKLEDLFMRELYYVS